MSEVSAYKLQVLFALLCCVDHGGRVIFYIILASACYALFHFTLLPFPTSFPLTLFKKKNILYINKYKSIGDGERAKEGSVFFMMATDFFERWFHSFILLRLKIPADMSVGCRAYLLVIVCAFKLAHFYFLP